MKDKRPNQKNRKKGKKFSGVTTVYLGEPDSPLLQALESVCIMEEKTVSEVMRKMIVYGLKQKGFL